MNRKPIRILSLLLGLLVACAPAFAGVYYQAETSTDQKGGDFLVRGWVDGEKAKVEFVESDDRQMLPQGGYLLTTDAGRTVYLVNPKEETIMEWDLEAMFASLGALMEATPMMNFEITDPKVEKLVEEDGPEMLGHDTTHYRLQTEYGMKMKVLGMGRTNQISMLQDVWVTDDLDAGEAMGVWLKTFKPTGFGELDELMEQHMEVTTGFPLRSVVETTMTGKKGKRSNTTRSETVVTELDTSRSIDASTFELPAGYERVEMPQMGAAEGGEEEESGNPLRGLFGGKKNDGR